MNKELEELKKIEEMIMSFVEECVLTQTDGYCKNFDRKNAMTVWFDKGFEKMLTNLLTQSQDEIKKEATEGFVKFLARNSISVSRDYEVCMPINFANRLVQEYLTQQSLDKGDSK